VAFLHLIMIPLGDLHFFGAYYYYYYGYGYGY
jgi:hypothetical protein